MHYTVALLRVIHEPHRLALCSLAVAAIAVAVLGSEAAEPTNPWQQGQYRDLIPVEPAAKAGGVTTRSLGPSLKLSQTVVQRPRVSPGESAALRAQYTVTSPGESIEVRETRVIRFNGGVLATLIKVAPRPDGPVVSEYQLRIPVKAASGWYAVTTIIEPAQPSTRSVSQEQANTGFYVESTPANGAPTPLKDAPPPGEEGVKVKLWANKPQYKIGDTLTVSFETNRDAFVTLVNVGTSGAMTILFPNRFSGTHLVKGKRTYTIPAPDDTYELQLSGPSGTELIYALVTLKPVKFIETDFSRTPQIFQSVNDASANFTRDINAIAKKTPLREQAKGVLELEVTP